jgi:hypothetical protein
MPLETQGWIECAVRGCGTRRVQASASPLTGASDRCVAKRVFREAQRFQQDRTWALLGLHYTIAHIWIHGTSVTVVARLLALLAGLSSHCEADAVG